jgi:hypothetical protein
MTYEPYLSSVREKPDAGKHLSPTCINNPLGAGFQ